MRKGVVFAVVAALALVGIAVYAAMTMREARQRREDAAAFQRFAATCEGPRPTIEAFGKTVAASGGSYDRGAEGIERLEQGLAKVTAAMTEDEVEQLAGPPNYVRAAWYQGETLMCTWTYVYSGKTAGDAFTAATENNVGFGEDGRVSEPPSGPWHTIERRGIPR